MKRCLLLILVVCLFLVGNTVGVYSVLTSQRELLVWDFQPLWQAGRWIGEDRGSPYSAEMTHLLQMQSYGRLAGEGEDPHAFVYPLYVLLLVWPLIFLPLPWAQAAWFTMLELGVVAGVIGVLTLTGRRPSVRQALLTVMWGFLLYPIAWALALGQVSILIFALIIVALLALQAGLDSWAGVCLALATAKPQMSFLLVPVLLLWALGRRRYRFLLFFAGAMGVLLLLSFAVLPGWLMDTLRSGAGYLKVWSFPSPVALLGESITGPWGGKVSAVLGALLLVGLAWAWWRERRRRSPPVWVVGLTLVVTELVAPRTSVANQVSLLLPLTTVLASWAARGRGWKWAGVVAAVVLLAGPWILDILLLSSVGNTVRYREQHVLLAPLLPAVTLLLLIISWAESRI